jgi:ABC-type xylose transport system permease subunit
MFVALIGVPSFVVTLAGNAHLAGRDLKARSGRGRDRDQDNQINDVANYVLTKNTG